MKKTTLFLTALFPALALSTPEVQLNPAEIHALRQDQLRNEAQDPINSARLEKRPKNLPHFNEQAPNLQRVSIAQLKQNPRLTQHLLTQAIYARNPELIEKLLEIYRTFPQRDPIMERFAEAKLAALTENYAKAIEDYREILAKNPNLNPVRIELAIALFNQKQDDAAKEQFEKAQSAADLPHRHEH